MRDRYRMRDTLRVLMLDPARIWGPKEVAGASELQTTYYNAYAALTRLTTQGLAEKVASGAYRVTAKGKEAAECTIP